MIGIGKGHITLAKEFLLNRLSNKSSDYADGYKQALDDLSGILECQLEDQYELQLIKEKWNDEKR
ncbi:hypothetical protein [Streptococcus uberis]|uniref:hypothetical protein n=1 Tax=Streptococcus uberis TaxID=1349 RepID=UPI001FF2EB51|nr:hypothetical protein [Streptococcus uberis]MCK1226012.1 hypothetical protein [Streptococcus uberis]